MIYESIEVKDICELKYGYSLPKKNRCNGNIPVFGSNGVVGWHNITKIKGPAIIVGRKGSIGKLHFIKNDCWPIDTTYFINEFKKPVDFQWFYYLMSTLRLESLNKAAAVPGLNRNDVYQIKIPLPPLPVQKKIAAILDAADALRQKDKALIAKYTELAQSLFLEMFGDPVVNPMGWESVKLDIISDIASGVTKGRKLKNDKIIDLPYLRVANVQDGYLDLTEVKTIPGTVEDLDKFGLHKEDILLTEGGDPDKLGRGSVWNEEVKDCIHQNHIFRVRLTSKNTLPLYFSKLCGSEYGKRYFLRSGKQTTGIASINKTQLRRFPVLCPPIELQAKFAERIEAINQQKHQAELGLQKSEALFGSLMQKAFKGELVS